MENINRIPLDLDLYDKFGIDQTYSAFKITISNINPNCADNFESEYSQQGYKIFHSDMTANKKGTFTLELILAKLEYTF